MALTFVFWMVSLGLIVAGLVRDRARAGGLMRSPLLFGGLAAHFAANATLVWSLGTYRPWLSIFWAVAAVVGIAAAALAARVRANAPDRT